MDKIICNVYKSLKKDGMYLYTKKQDLLSSVPDALLSLFGDAKLVMTMLLTTEKQLDRADIEDVMKQINEKGFYLQMPLVEDDEMREIAEKNTKLLKS